MAVKMWIISNYYPKLEDGVEIKTNPIFEWSCVEVPDFKIRYISKINLLLGSIFANFVYPEREKLISRLLLEEFNNNINFYYPWLKNFAKLEIADFIELGVGNEEFKRSLEKEKM